MPAITAAALTFHEGDLARILCHTNALKGDASIHWHGMLVPNRFRVAKNIPLPRATCSAAKRATTRTAAGKSASTSNHYRPRQEELFEGPERNAKPERFF